MTSNKITARHPVQRLCLAVMLKAVKLVRLILGEHNMRDMAANTRKFKELVLYVANRSANDLNYGSTKLNKLVAFSDMVHFAKTGRTITNANYMKQPNGFVATCMKPALVALEQSGELEIKPTERYGRIAKVPVARREANIEDFKADEIATVNEVIEALKDHNNEATSRLSHDLTPNWNRLPVKAEIPWATILFPAEYNLSDEEVKHFQELLKNTEWGKKVSAGNTA